MATQTELINRALIRLGSATITSITDNTPTAVLANNIYDSVVREVIGEGHWSTAKFRANLNKTTNTPLYGYGSEFQLPTDPPFLKVIEINEDVAGDVDHRIEQDKLLTDKTSIDITYIGLIENTQEYGTYLTEAIIAKLALEMCFAETNNANLVREMQRIYQQTLASGLAKDGQQGSRKRIFSSDLTDIR